MTIFITIHTDNDAFFADSYGDELAAVLRKAAKKCEGTTEENLGTALPLTLMDSNGNKVGIINDRRPGREPQ